MRHLIISICNSGNAESIMMTAKQVGAKGGTIINARGSAKKDAEQFLGITIQPEKELLIIITNEDEKNQIMQAINQNHGIGTISHAITLSLPVDDIVGIDI